MSDFKALKAAYIALSGKNPPPMSADALRAKVDELAAAAAAQQDPPAQDPPAQDPPAQDPPAQDPPAQDTPAQDPPAREPASDDPASADPEQSVEDACAELEIEPDAEGNVEIELLTSLAGVNVKAPGEGHICGAAEAVRMIRAGFAKPRA